jgi:hypothetical protein
MLVGTSTYNQPTTMNKLLALLFLSFTIACSAWAEKYEYVRILDGQEPITLESGDIAWWVNTNCYYCEQYSEDGTEMATHNWTASSAVGGVAQLSRTFVGPCKIGTDYNNGLGPTSFNTFKILRTSESGYKTLEWDGSKYAGTTINNSNSSSGVVDPTNIQYDELFGWAYFTDSNWVYSYTNLSWYYMHSMDGDIYVWNANLPDNGWTKWTRS